MHTNLIILAGGASSRMKKSVAAGHESEREIAQANHRSKALITVDQSDRPVLDYLLYNAKKAGYSNIYLVISEEGDLFKTYYGTKQKDNDFNGLSISYAIQYIPSSRKKPYGTADALFQAVEQYPELNLQPYTVCNSDNLYSTEVLKSLRETTEQNALISYDREALNYPSERIARFAVARFDKNDHLVDIIEKPSEAEIENAKDAKGKVRVSMNIFKLAGGAVYDCLKNCPVHPERDEKELPTVVLNLVKDGAKAVSGIPFSEHVPDLTSKEDITIMKSYLKEHYTNMNWNE